LRHGPLKWPKGFSMDSAKTRGCQPEVYHCVHRGLRDPAVDKACREKIEARVGGLILFSDPFNQKRESTPKHTNLSGAMIWR